MKNSYAQNVLMLSLLCLSILAATSCSVKNKIVDLDNLKVSSKEYDSVVVERSRYFNGSAEVNDIRVLFYEQGSRKKDILYSEYGILKIINLHDSLISGYDSTSGRAYQISKGQTMVFDKKGRLRFQFDRTGFSPEGLCFVYSTNGLLSAIYNFENNKVVDVVYCRNEKFRKVDSLFTPYSVLVP